MGSRISLRGNLERKSCIGRCSNSVKEKKQSLPAVSTDFPDDMLPFVASVEQNPLKGRTGFRVGDLYQEPFVREISLDRFNRQGLHKFPRLRRASYTQGRLWSNVSRLYAYIASVVAHI